MIDILLYVLMAVSAIAAIACVYLLWDTCREMRKL